MDPDLSDFSEIFEGDYDGTCSSALHFLTSSRMAAAAGGAGRRCDDDITFRLGVWGGSAVFWRQTKTDQSDSDSELWETPRSTENKIKISLQSVDFFWKDGLLDPAMLVQFWAPITTASGRIMLTAFHQPFYIGEDLYNGLCRYRYYCIQHQSRVEDITQLGPPGRVFALESPESCPDIKCYSTEEFPLRKHAIDCGILGYAAIPLFDVKGQLPRCVGVLEFLSFQSMQTFSLAVEEVISELQAHDLDCHFHKCKINPISRVLVLFSVAEFVMKIHQLPLIQVWVPCWSDIELEDYDGNNCSLSNVARRITFLRCEFTRCHWKLMPFFYTLKIFSESSISLVKNGKTLVERANSQNKACFLKDATQFSICDYPLVNLIRSSGLRACFAIPLQLIHPTFHPFLLEVFLPPEQNYEGYLKTIKSLLNTLVGRISRYDFQVEELSVKLSSHWDDDNVVYFDVYRKGEASNSQKALVQSSQRPPTLEENTRKFGSTDPTATKKCLILADHPNDQNRADTFWEFLANDEAHKPSFGGQHEVTSENLGGDRVQTHEIDREEQQFLSSHQPQTLEGSVSNYESSATAREKHSSSISDHANKQDKAETYSRDFTNAEAQITLDVIKSYFDRSLDDAARELGVSRSTLKRRCRELGIKRWPSRKRKKVNHIQSSARPPTGCCEGGAEVIQESNTEPPCPNSNATQKQAAASDSIPRGAKRKSIAAEDENDQSYAMFVKATYRDDTVKFSLCSNSKVEELCFELAQRFKLKVEGFKIKYKDDGDWILISCDQDLCFYMDALKSSEKDTMYVSIFPINL